MRVGSFRAELVTAAGRRLPLRDVVLDEHRASWGAAIPLPLRQVTLVRLVRDDDAIFEARLPRP
jgi:hypothetical protein